MSLLTVEVPDSIQRDFGLRPVLGTHNLRQHELFTDEAIAELLDHYPREHLYALTMGTDNAQTDQSRLAVHDGVSGASLLRAVRNGRIWLNATQLHRADLRYQLLVNDIYAELQEHVPDFHPESMQGTLLISSPHVLVYYHADVMPAVLWHLRGRKRIWIYPALDERYLKRHDLEDIFAGIRHEYLPFDHSFDEAAIVCDLQPGQWISWPPNAPHRVTNLDSLNVSLFTEHSTRDSRARAQLYVANRFLRMRLGCRNLSAQENGVPALFKTAVYRVARKAGLDPLKLKRHTAELRVDPDAPDGVVPIDRAGTGTAS